MIKYLRHNFDWMLMLIVSSSLFITSILFVYDFAFGKCYMSFDESIDYKDIEFAKNTFSRYISPINDIPVDGIKQNSCLYVIQVTYTNNGIQLSINGPRNYHAESSDFKSAFLSAIFDTSNVDLCKYYGDRLIDKCEIGINIMFVDLKGDFILRPTNGFRIIMIPRRRLYVYIINTDYSGVSRILFPTQNQNNPLLRKKIYVIPNISTGEYFHSNNIRSEKIYALFSIQPIENIEFLLNPTKKKGIFQKTIVDFQKP